MSYSWVLGSVAHSLTSCQEQLHPLVHNEMNSNLNLPRENSKQTKKAKPLTPSTFCKEARSSTFSEMLDKRRKLYALAQSKQCKEKSHALLSESGGHFLPALKDGEQ